MKKVKTQELREKTIDELKQLATKQRQEMVLAKLQAKAGKGKGGSVAALADQLARVLTVIREKELGL